MRVIVRTLTGAEYQVTTVEPTSTVHDLKLAVESISGIPAAQQRQIGGGKQLADDADLATAGIKDGDCVHLVLALR